MIVGRVLSDLGVLRRAGFPSVNGSARGARRLVPRHAKLAWKTAASGVPADVLVDSRNLSLAA
jgi:hypothetical protein